MDGLRGSQLSAVAHDVIHSSPSHLSLYSITIRFVGFGDVVVDVDPLCLCECEKNPVSDTFMNLTNCQLPGRLWPQCEWPLPGSSLIFNIQSEGIVSVSR